MLHANRLLCQGAGEPAIVVRLTFQISRCRSCLCSCLDTCHYVPFPISSSVPPPLPDATAFSLVFTVLPKMNRGTLQCTEETTPPNPAADPSGLSTERWPVWLSLRKRATQTRSGLSGFILVPCTLFPEAGNTSDCWVAGHGPLGTK